MTLLELLKGSRGLIAAGWTQKASARVKGGKPCSILSEEACQWCATGALLAVEQKQSSTSLIRLFGSATAELEQNIWTLHGDTWVWDEANEAIDNIQLFNDHERTTQRAVLDVFDSAIARLEAV